jgi:flagellin
MVTSVNGAALAALRAQENAAAGRATTDGSSAGSAAGASPNANPAVVYDGAPELPDLAAMRSVQDGLNSAVALSDVGLSAGRTISDLLGMMREKVASAQSASSDGEKQALDGDYQQLLKTIDQIASSASFQGVKVLDGASGDLQFKADPNGDGTVSLTQQDFTTGGAVIGLAGTSLLGSSDDLANVLSQVDAAGARVATQLSQMSAQADQIRGHLGVLSQAQSSLAGEGQADLDADSARLQALQVQQMLSDQGGGVAGNSPQALLSLFRS